MAMVEKLRFGWLPQVLILLTLAAPCFAAWTSIPSTDFLINDPPVAGSPAYVRDFRELHRLQEHREEKHCELAGTQVFPTFKAFFGPSAGVLSTAEFNKVAPLLGRVFKFSERVANDFKERYHRRRPYVVDTTIHPCVTKPGGEKSYPSAHAVMASAAACLLQEKYPAKATRLREYGIYLGELRAIVGVHYPSDVEAGQALGLEICHRLLSEEDFKSEF